MPGTYSDSFTWVVGPCDNTAPQTLEGYCKFTVSGICPVDDRSNESTASGKGYCGGDTQEEALREFAAWNRMSAYDSQRQEWADRGFTYYLYNHRSREYILVNVAPPLTPEEIARSKRMMNVKLFKESGKLFLTVDAAGLHETLDAIGCQTETNSAGVVQYKDRPHTSVAVLDNNSHSLSTELLLKKGVQRVDLSTVYSRPPTGENLKKLANSANDKCRLILEHYQPIDIQVTIQKKVLGAA